jgi:hypothetical protein
MTLANRYEASLHLPPSCLSVQWLVCLPRFNATPGLSLTIWLRVAAFHLGAGGSSAPGAPERGRDGYVWLHAQPAAHAVHLFGFALA